MSFDIVGFDNNYKVPRFAASIVFGAGAISAASLPLRVLLVGMKTSAGSMTPDVTITQCLSAEDADAKAGAGSQLARMAYKALQIPNVEIWMMAVTEPGAGSAATATLALGGTWSTPGEACFRIGGESVYVPIGASDAIDTVGAAMAAAINARTRLPVTASYNTSTDTLTITCKQKGIHGIQWIVAYDTTNLPSGITGTLTGSAAVGTNRVRMGASSSGTGTEDVTTALAALLTGRWARIAAAQNDATNAALWETQVNTKAGPTSILLEQVVFGHTSAYATAQSIAQTTLNAQRASVLWMRNSESHPCEIAASMAAVRAATEGADPVPDYDGLVLPGIAPVPAGYDTDIPTETEQNTALNNGVTPVTTVNGQAKVVRGITSYCLLGSTPDYRTIDIGDAVMPDYAALDLKLMYETEFRPANKYVGPDTPVESEPAPAGVATPRLWNSKLAARLNQYFKNNWIEDPTLYPPASSHNSVAKRIQSVVTLVVRRVQHQLGQTVRQQA